MDKKVLITGGTGLIGRLCIEELKKISCFTVSLSRSTKLTPSECDYSVNCDLSDKEKIFDIIKSHEITHIIHTAGLRTSSCIENPSDAFAINATGTLNIFEAARKAGHVEKIVMTSTAAVYDTNVQNEDCDEQSKTIALNPYTASKLAAENIAECYYRQYNISSVILRPQIVFGYERTGEGSTVSPSIAMQKSYAGQEYKIGFRGTYSYHHTGDAAKFHVLPLFDERLSFECFNLPGTSVSVSEICHVLNEYAREKHGINRDLIAYGGPIRSFAKNINCDKFLKYFPDIKSTSFDKAMKLRP